MLSGSTRAMARAKSEPQVNFEIPEPPVWITAGARSHWQYVVDLVEPLRCTGLPDAGQMAVFAQCLYDWTETARLIEENGPTAISEKGAEYASPHVNRQASVYSRLQNCFDRFGLNPASRSKVSPLAVKLGEVVKMETKKSRYADSGEE
jgi:P27 family predicted phage terminase small subunit